jgi:uncharacterized protein YjiS (DUF1127 family)
VLVITKVNPNIQGYPNHQIPAKYARKYKWAIQQNQVPTRIALSQPGVSRRLALIVDRGDESHLVPGTGISMEKFHEYQLLGRRLQARAMASAFTSLFRTVVFTFGKLAAAFGRARARGAAIRELGSLDDHLLQDIGIRRENIPAAVAGLMNRQPAVGRAAPRQVLRPATQRTACNDAHAKAAA